MRINSLRLRLALLLSVFILLAWLIASGFAYYQTRHSITELFDTQQSLLARQLLLGVDANDLLLHGNARLPPLKHLLKADKEGEVDDDALGFAIFNAAGEILFSDGANGRYFNFEPGRTGFITQKLQHENEKWRIVFISNRERSLYIAVGQEIEYRREAVQAIVLAQFWPWLSVLPLLVIAMWWMISRELAPLRVVAAELANRSADKDTPIAPERVPQEVRPLIHALNALFVRGAQMITHSRRFTADAAHELRSPLAGLRVQAEVALLAENDAITRNRALKNLNKGIDRAARLVDQLLALSRLDPIATLPNIHSIDWQSLAQQALEDAELQIKTCVPAKILHLALEQQGTPKPLQGDGMLLSLLLRNLLDNAVRYTPDGGQIILRFTEAGFEVQDNGVGVAAEYLDRIHERFFRPPGQTETGSGLGLSIVERIATLHGMRLLLSNVPDGGFKVSLRY